METTKLLKNAATLVALIREKTPLIHHLTNYVTVNDCANIVLACGGSPIMADEINEVEEVIALASAVILNIGTLNQRTLESMLAAGKKANELGVPVILDPVGAGATTFRTDSCHLLLENVDLAVIRGNASEIKAVGGLEATTLGVDVAPEDLLSEANLASGKTIVQSLAHKFNCVVAMTGEVDLISHGKKTYALNNGHPWLAGITGTGCMCSSLIGTYSGITTNYLEAALTGVMVLSIAGEIAAEEIKAGMATFRTKLIDQVSLLEPQVLLERGKIREL